MVSSGSNTPGNIRPLPADLPPVCVVLPTYNEAENITAMIHAIFSQPVPNLQVVVVDDNSPDGTGQQAERLRQKFGRRLHVLHRSEKQGLGPAYRAGFQYALAEGAEFVVQMDADFSHSPDDIPRLLQAALEKDLVIGSRYIRGGGVDHRWNWWRRMLSRWANSVYVRAILGTQVRDATGGFKCWSRDALATVLRQPVSSCGYLFQVEMNYLAEKLGFRLQEIPIYFEDRRIGRSKLSASVKLEAAWRTWILRWRYRELRPVGEAGQSLSIKQSPVSPTHK